MEEGESHLGVWLRLHNNASTALFVPVFSVPVALGQVGMFYDIVPASRRDDYRDISHPAPELRVTGMPAGYKLGHTSSAHLLRPGRSVLFSVPREHLPEGVALQIAFNYEWALEGEMEFVRIGEPQHYVLFYSESLPK